MKTTSICFVFLFSLFSFSISAKEAEEDTLAMSQVDSLRSLAKEYYHIKDYQKSLECYFKIVDIYTEKNDGEQLANTYSDIVSFFIILKDYDLAEKYQRIMSQSARKTLNPFIRGMGFSNTAQICYFRHEYDHTIRNGYISIIYFRKAKMPVMEARAYKLLGDAFVQKKVFDMAFFCYRTANTLYLQRNEDQEMAVIYTRIAHIYQVLFDFPNNLQYNLKAKLIREKSSDTAMIASSYLNVGEAYWLIGKKDTAQAYISRALLLAVSVNNNYLLEAIYNQRYDFARQEGNFKEALLDYTKCIEHRKKWNQDQNQAEIAQLVANHTISAVEARNDLLMQENQIQNLQFKKRRLETIIYEVVFLSLMLLIMLINTLARNNRKRKNKLLVLNEQLKTEIHERIEAEGRLHRSEELHRFLAENTVDVISLLDANMRRLYISPSCEKFYGYTPAEIMQMNSPLE